MSNLLPPDPFRTLNASPRATQESSWDPPPEWQGTSATWGADYRHDEAGIGGAGGFAGGSGGGEDYERGENSYGENNNNYVSQEAEYTSSSSAPNSSAPHGPPEGGYGAMTSADATGQQPADETATTEQTQGSGGAGGGTRGSPRGGSRGDNSSDGGESSLDGVSADELSQWSLEKLREVSKVKRTWVFLFFFFPLPLLSRSCTFSRMVPLVDG